MKAVQFHDYGEPSVLCLEDVPEPKPAAGEVLVRVHATSVNPVDCAIRAGHLRLFRDVPRPFILGWDFSGVIADLGEGVTEWSVGDEVFGHPSLMSGGTYADYVAVPASVCARKPASLDHEQAAAIPLTGLTAWQALFEHARLVPGQSVLIQGGAGGVGSLAVQFAALRGIHVSATCSARNLDLVRELGAERAIDYNGVPFETVVSNMDAAIDGVAGEVRERSWTTLKPNGILVALTGAPPDDAAAAERGFTQVTMWARPDRAQLAEIAALIDAGKVRPIIEAIVPLTEAARAHRMKETGHARGKIILRVA